VLDGLEIPYLVGGSLASSLYGIPRSTHDADVVADLAEEDVPRLIVSLRELFYLDEERITEAIRARTSFNLLHLATVVKVDIFVLRATVFARQEMIRRQTISLPGTGRHLVVASAEDTILQKLRWYEVGGRSSDQQWRDILGVLKVRASSLDRSYLDRWAQALDLGELLARATEDAGLPPSSAG